MAGGVFDQPLSEWVGAEQAGYIWYLLDKIASPHFKWSESGLSQTDYDVYDQIIAVRNKRICQT